MSDQVSGLFALHFWKDSSGNLTTATPVDIPLAGDVYHSVVQMPQDGCLRAIIARIETTPNTANPDLVSALTLDGTEDTVGLCNIAIGATEAYATFENNEVPIDKDEDIGASIEMTGGTIDDAVDEVHLTLIVQLGRSNI